MFTLALVYTSLSLFYLLLLLLQKPAVCPAKTWYSLALESLRGVCQDVEEAGYQVFDEETLAFLTQMYGPPIAREATAPIPPTGMAPSTPMGQGFVGQGRGSAGFPGQTGSLVSLV